MMETRSIHSATHLKVALVYTDVRAGAAAMQLYGSLVRQLNDTFLFQVSSWHLGSRQEPQVLVAAGEAAAAADIVVCSFDGSGQLLLMAADWVNSWIIRRSVSDGALVVLVQAAQLHPNGFMPAEVYLRNVAYLAGMDFFVHKSVAPVSDRPAGCTPWSIGTAARLQPIPSSKIELA